MLNFSRKEEMLMKYVKLLNLIPLLVFFAVERLFETLLNPIPVIIILALGIMNIILAKNMKEYLVSSLLLLASSVIGMIFESYYYYYFVNTDPEAPIVGAFFVIVYGLFVLLVAGIGAAITASKKNKNKE